MRTFIVTALIGCAASVYGGGAFAMQNAAPTEVESLTVTASAEVRVSLAAGGDIDEQTYVVSAPGGLACGGFMYRHSKDPTRQCWVWVRRNKPAMLAAQAPGRFGVDWTVEWGGCTPIGGAACEVVPGDDVAVAAVFKRLH